MVLLTKSKYLNGLQCHRLLWFADRKQLPEITLSDQHKFDQGHEFEEYVKKLYSDAVDFNGLEFQDNIDKTQEAVKENKAIFEAGFKVRDLFVRSDLIIPNGDGWDLYEIKSSKEVKPQHIPDLAFQKYVLERSGLKIVRTFVIFLNKEYVKNGDIDPGQLIVKEEVTEKVDLIDDIEANTHIFIRVLEQDKAPRICISMQCNKPYECPLKPECHKILPEYNVLQLTNWRLYWRLLSVGIEDVNEIPKGTKLTTKDQIIIQSMEKSPVVSKEHIKHFLDSLHYPLYHFDFETYDTAVPIFDKSRPYQKIPFQYSLHIEQEEGSVEHREFLATNGDDPRPKLLEQMKTDLEGTGDIIVYNKSFELNIMKNLADDFPEHKDWLDQTISRIVDLADPFKAFHYYHKSQKGSYSIKKVLPALTGNGYDKLEISNGGDASMMFFYSHVRDKLKNRDEIIKNLLKYCCLDTEGMTWIIRKLKIMSSDE